MDKLQILTIKLYVDYKKGLLSLDEYQVALKYVDKAIEQKKEMINRANFEK